MLPLCERSSTSQGKVYQGVCQGGGGCKRKGGSPPSPPPPREDESQSTKLGPSTTGLKGVREGGAGGSLILQHRPLHLIPMMR